MVALEPSLRYMEPAQVVVKGLRCSNMTVGSSTGHVLGALKGFVVDPVARQLKYLVVCGRGWFSRPALFPVDSAQVDMRERVIRLQADETELRRSRIVITEELRRISDDDLMAMLFGPHSHVASTAA